MHDKPQATPAREFHLPGHAVVAISGPDAAGFAQAQFMNDVAALADGQWQWNGWLTPKGRVIALFALLRLDAQTLWICLPDADAAGLVDALRRYVFRSKLALALRDDLHACGSFTAPALARGERWARIGDAIELDMSADGGARTLRLQPARAGDDAAAVARWNGFDLAHGLPRLPLSQEGLWTPQQLSLERLRAFSVKKGCYPGQEIVARTHFLGQAKRGLALLEAGAATAGDGVVADARAIGSLVSAAPPLALAVLPVERPDALQLATGIPVRARPLAGGLAR